MYHIQQPLSYYTGYSLLNCDTSTHMGVYGFKRGFVSSNFPHFHVNFYLWSVIFICTYERFNGDHYFLYCVWLRHYATSRKVATSSPDEVDFFS
jgi:hypothetical protein